PCPATPGSLSAPPRRRRVGQDAAGGDAQRNAGHDALDRRAAGDAPAGGRVGRRAGGPAPLPGSRCPGAAVLTSFDGVRDRALPETGSVEVVPRQEAAEIVEEAAHEQRPLLIALDLDGTVLLEDESLSPGVVEAVRHAREAGHEVMVATGRSWSGTRGILTVLQLAPEYVVCSNGAVVLQRVSEHDVEYARVHVETFDPTEVLKRLHASLPD